MSNPGKINKLSDKRNTLKVDRTNVRLKYCSKVVEGWLYSSVVKEAGFHKVNHALNPGPSGLHSNWTLEAESTHVLRIKKKKKKKDPMFCFAITTKF